MDFPTGCTGEPPSGDDEYDLLNDETFGDIQEDFDWEAANRLAEEGSNGKADESQLGLKVKELSLGEELDDPAIITSQARQIPTLSQEDNLRTIYDTHSPPAYISNIDGLLNPSKDIWGSPPTGSLEILSETSASKPDSVRDAYLSTSLEKTAGFPPPPAAAKAASEISLDSPAAMPKNAMTVEELERQLSSEPISVATERSSQLPPGLAGYGSPYQAGLMGTPPTPPSTHGFLGSPQTRSPLSMNGMQLARGQMSNVMSQRPVRAPVTILQRPHAVDTQRHPMMGGQGFSPLGPVPRYNPPPGFMPRHPQIQRGHMSGPAMVRMPMGMPPQRPGYVPPRFMAGQQHPQMYMPLPGQPRDEYSGILTKQEKDWLVKIQMIQLHSDDPYTDDYYYTIFNLEKASKSNSGPNRNSSLILPAMAKVETRQYTPMQFEGSLGRLTSSSVHKPRQVLDVGEKNDHLSHTAAEIKKYRQSLFTAEKGYRLLLEMDELKKKVPSVPEEQRSGMQMGCQKKLMKLHQLVDENWPALLNIRKGRSLILRTLPLVDKHSCKHLMERLLGGLSLLIKKELADGVEVKSLRCLVDILHHYDINSLLQLSLLLTPSLSTLIETSFGCHLLLWMTNQAEKIYSAYVDVAPETTESWNSFVDKIVETLISCKSLPSLRGMPFLIHDHIAKRPNSEQALEKIKDWLD